MTTYTDWTRSVFTLAMIVILFATVASTALRMIGAALGAVR